MALIDDWVAAKKTLDDAKAKEMVLRIQLIGAVSSRGAMASGVENVPVWGGGIIKITHKLDYNLSKDNDQIDAMLDKIEASQEGGNVIAERLVKWEASLLVSEFKKLTAAQQAIVAPVLTIKEASKSVEFVPAGGAS